MTVEASNDCHGDPTVIRRERVRMNARDDGLGTSVGKALAVFDAFRGGGHLLGVSQIAERAQIPKSTAHRLLSVLVDHGYVDRVDARYQLGMATFELGNSIGECRPRRLRSVAIPYMTDLHRHTNATVHLAVLDGLDVLYVDKIYGHHGVEVSSRIGGRAPAMCTALGKALVAFCGERLIDEALSVPVPRMTSKTMTNPAVLRSALQRTQQTGLAYDIEGSSLGAHCVAAPILGPATGDVLGALSLTFRLTDKPGVAGEDRLRSAATAISSRCA